MRSRSHIPKTGSLLELRTREATTGLAVILGFIALLAPIVANELEHDADKQARLAVRHLAGALPLLGDVSADGHVVYAGEGSLPRVGRGHPQPQPLGSALLPPRRIERDPWGRAYVVLRFDPSAPEELWVLSAGPDGAIQTDASAEDAAGDDVGLRVRVPGRRE
ncbi:MAG: hypothetical protein RL885_20405 [Planctomycetota bacterium]